jgi:hypothetical protein
MPTSPKGLRAKPRRPPNRAFHCRKRRRPQTANQGSPGGSTACTKTDGGTFLCSGYPLGSHALEGPNVWLWMHNALLVCLA